jgi:hypothetical protein
LRSGSESIDDDAKQRKCDGDVSIRLSTLTHDVELKALADRIETATTMAARRRRCSIIQLSDDSGSGSIISKNIIHPK